MPSEVTRPPRDPTQAHRALPLWLRALIALTALLIAALVVTASLAKELDHDEHQFVASAYLFAKHDLLPYLDYAYFHVPNLVGAYGALFRISDHLLLSARLFSAACALVTLALIGGYAARLFRHARPTARLAIALGSVIVVIASPFFTYTSGLAWNHDASVLLSLAAALVLLQAMGSKHRVVGLVVSGALLGLGIGTRLTALPLLPPMLAGVLWLEKADGPRYERLYRVGWFGLGLAPALTPSLLFLAAAPQDFMFGNFEYAFLNTAYREATGFTRAMSMPGKILFFLERAADPGNLMIFILLGFMLYSIGRERLRERAGREVVLLVALVVFAFLGSLAPTPSFPQYFYALVPLSLVASLRGMAIVANVARKRAAALRLFAVVVIICALRGLPSYFEILGPLTSEAAVAIRTHRLGLQIRERVGSGKVLTLAPIYPLEGGLEIYRHLTTGPFAWRTASYLPIADRARHGMIGPGELRGLLDDQAPAAILVGAEPDELEAPLIEEAEMLGFQPVALAGSLTLWIPPSPGHARVDGPDSFSVTVLAAPARR